MTLVECGLWLVRDASRRGKSPLLVLIAVLMFSPFGLIAWFLFRPPVAQRLSRKGSFAPIWAGDTPG
jgi:hypothetical protein